MKGKWSVFGVLFMLGAALLVGCVPPVDQTGDGTDVVSEVPEGVVVARDAALAYIAEYYGQQVEPEPGQVWAEKRTTPEGLLGAESFEFAAGNWVVTVSYPVVAPDAVIYHVVALNSESNFQWEGSVGAQGDVVERVAPEQVLAARDVALAYLLQNHGQRVGPEPGQVWVEKRTTPEGLLGAESFEFAAGNWIVVVSYPVVAPDMLIYHVVVTNTNSGYQWEGDVDAKGQVTEPGG